MPNLERDWHGRSGWAVEITYAARPEEPYWGIDDLATRIAAHAENGLRVLVRVDYDQQQSVPPADDFVALSEYLAYFSRLSRDARLEYVYGYIVGNEYNTVDAVAIIAGSIQLHQNGMPVSLMAMVKIPIIQTMLYKPSGMKTNMSRVIVGPVRPWSFDADGRITHTTQYALAELYEHTSVAYLDESGKC